MKAQKIIGLLVVVLLTGSVAMAQIRYQRVTQSPQQRGFKLNLNYNVGIPAGEFQDFVSETSWRGWTANLVYGINNWFAVGLGTGFQDFYEKYPRAVYNLQEGGEISAVVTNSIQTIPVLAVAQFNLAPRGWVQPYVSIGIGGNIIVFDQHLGQFSNSQSDIGFAARPEVGFMIPIGRRGFGINLNGTYNYMPYNENGVNDIDHWGVGAGIRFSLR